MVLYAVSTDQARKEDHSSDMDRTTIDPWKVYRACALAERMWRCTACSHMNGVVHTPYNQSSWYYYPQLVMHIVNKKKMNTFHKHSAQPAPYVKVADIRMQSYPEEQKNKQWSTSRMQKTEESINCNDRMYLYRLFSSCFFTCLPRLFFPSIIWSSFFCLVKNDKLVC